MGFKGALAPAAAAKALAEAPPESNALRDSNALRAPLMMLLLLLLLLLLASLNSGWRGRLREARLSSCRDPTWLRRCRFSITREIVPVGDVEMMLLLHRYSIAESTACLPTDRSTP